jgi:hypothetical protein
MAPERARQGIRIDRQPPRRETIGVGIEVPTVGDDDLLGGCDEGLRRPGGRRGAELDHDLRTMGRAPGAPDQRLPRRE